MNNTLLLIISIAANLCNSILKKDLTDRYFTKRASLQLYNAVTCAVSAIVLLILSESMTFSLFTVLLALAFGITLALQTIFHLMALECGPFSYTTVIITLSMLIPTLSGAAFWGETIRPIQIAGIVLMAGCFILSVNHSGDQKKVSVKWLLYCVVAFLCTGLIGIMQKVHQSSDFRNELDAFLFIAFLFSFLYSCAGWIIASKKAGSKSTETTKSNPAFTWKPLLLMVISGICLALNNKLNLYLSGVMESAVFFPIVNGAALILTTLSAFILFRERLSSRQWVGLLLGISAVLFLCAPIR